MKLLKKLLCNVNKVCVFTYLAGVIWFILLSHPQFHARCYFSENALSPGLVHSQFASSNNEIARFNRYFTGDTEKTQQTMISLLQSIGLEVHQQKFAFREDFINQPEEFQLKNGTNIYGFMRAPRSAGTESVVINIPLFHSQLNYAVGIALALAKQMRGEMHWAKDIVFLFTEHDSYGAQAWLDAYHGTPSFHIAADPLTSHAGSIQAAIVMEMKDKSFTYINLKLEGYNGQLPNMDLSNLAVRLFKLREILASVNYQFHPYDPSTMDGFKSFLKTTLKMMKQLSTGMSSGNHGDFLRYNIEAITLEGIRSKQHPNRDLLALHRILEGICRSLNNLLERFHQSFFFYLLPSTERYISIGMYMPCLGLVLLAPVLKALSMLVRSEITDSDVTEEQSDDQKESIDDILQDVGSKYFEETVQTPTTQWNSVVQMMILCHVAGYLLFRSPSFTPVWSSMFSLTFTTSFIFLLVTVHLAALVFMELHSQHFFSFTQEGAKNFRVASLLHAAIAVGVISIMNFSLGFIVSLFLVPVVTFIQTREGWLKYLQKLSLIIISLPLIHFYTHHAYEVVQIYNFHLTNRSWLFPAASLVYFPMWLQLWGITCCSKHVEIAN
ncbi:unnamed protein product [Clavelina lepadiformis]|uniref:Glycosylphosphatidylinositol anchor attachment 1 protein n=1 Tax=Clavelina lepadiformis TaxID=159417 RepID=A0ABP0GUY1_CLALP